MAADPSPSPGSLTSNETFVEAEYVLPRRYFRVSGVAADWFETDIRGISRRTRSIRRTRHLPVASDPGYTFERLRPGRYEAVGTYEGDSFRQPTVPTGRRFTLSKPRCRTYVSGSGYRRHKPRIIYVGASQRIYDLAWSNWNRRTARATGTFPSNDCVPYCAAGTITPYPINVRLSRVRVCNRFLQYLTLRWTYRGSRPARAPRSQRVTFDYVCD